MPVQRPSLGKQKNFLSERHPYPSEFSFHLSSCFVDDRDERVNHAVRTGNFVWQDTRR